jgi:hypothetical protein
LIPILPPGTPVEAAAIGGNPVQLLATPDGLAWSTKKSGSYNMNLSYRVDAMRSQAGFTLAVPLPQAAATQLTASLPGSGLDVALIPAAGVKISQSGKTTRVSATVPTTSGVQISWRTPSRRGHTISRASYSGRLVANAVDWSGKLSVELFSDETATLSLLPRSVTMSDLKVDGQAAPILVEGDRFVTLVKGRGVHSVVVEFQVPVVSGDGPPRMNLQVPPVPVSRFDLTLPGKKELTVTPAASIRSRIRGGSTIATVHVPLTGQVSFAWSEAVPEDIKAEVRSNASLYHVLHAEEGVLNGRVTVQYEVNRGETHLIKLAVPDDVQINRISAESGAVADWRLASAARRGAARTVTVFLDRQLKGELLFDIFYDRSLAPSAEEGGIQAPLFQALGVHRQKGMVALLANHDLALSPVGEPDETQATRVGENQLPAFVRDEVTMTVAHTFKYADALPRVMIETSIPEVVQGIFDAQVDTLISLGEVTMTGAASLEVHLKSGRVSSLELELPEGINLLSLTAPSLRTYAVNPQDDAQVVSIEFTQEMEGQFRLELTYERILSDDTSEVDVPTLTVRGAEVEQGRIAVEALSAVEVQAAATEQLSSLDIKELPQQLILRTTNPILLAYKYVHAAPTPRLALNVTRHRVLGTQEAVIDRAEYRTLFTRDGLFVTTAHFVVRNSRKQFLRVQLPERSQIWSVFVNGKPENPARSDGGDEEERVLIKVLNSTRGFPVQIVYATEGSGIRGLGKVEAALPRPDILVTESRWDAFLPAEMRYGDPSTNMDIVKVGAPVSASELEAQFARLADGAGAQQALEPLRITVPASGVHYAFEKLSANQSDQDAWFSVPYASAGGAFAGQLANFVGIALFWAGIWLSRRGDARMEPRRALAIAGVGVVILLTTIGFYSVSATLPMVLSVLVGLALAARHGKAYVAQLRQSFADQKPQSG